MQIPIKNRSAVISLLILVGVEANAQVVPLVMIGPTAVAAGTAAGIAAAQPNLPEIRREVAATNGAAAGAEAVAAIWQAATAAELVTIETAAALTAAAMAAQVSDLAK